MIVRRGALVRLLASVSSYFPIVALTILFGVSAARAQTSGLVAAYSFNEGSGTTVADSSGNNNTGTITGATWTTAGKFGSALVFNGTSARVTVNDAPSLRLTGGMTLEAWVKPSAVTTAWRDVIYKGNDNYYLEATSNSASRAPAAGGTIGTTYGTTALATNTWAHLAVTYDRVAIRLYVNGTQVSSLARTTALATSANPLQIGGDSIYGQYFQGTIDEVRVYNRALSQAEIQTDMNSAVGGAPPPDTTAPTVSITTPTSSASYTTATSPLTVGGTAADNVGVTQVSWSNSAGGSGIASGTTTWSVASITLQPGTNVVTITARDAANNTGTGTLTVTYTAPDTTAPTVSITTPTSSASYSTNATPLTLGGTAADNVGVTQVSWSNSAGGSGIASGTTTWSATGITLQPGANVLTVTANDAASNTATATITVTYDPTAPTIAITAPASGGTVSGTTTITASASDNVGVAGVQFLVDGNAVGAEQTTSPFAVSWNTGSVPNGTHTVSARARDAAGNSTVATGVSVTVANTQLPGLVAAYAFDEGSGTTVRDSSGNNNTGAITGATWTTAGRFGGALVFNGTNARVTINDAPSLRLTTGMTLEAWVNPSVVTAAWRDVVYKGNDNYYLEATSDRGSVPGAGATIGTTFGTTALAPNTWTHLAVTYDRVAIRLYVNGIQVSSVAATASLATSTNPLQIGGDSIFGQYFQGTIDEVRVYNRALTAQEIQNDMSVGVAGGAPPSPDTTPPTVTMTAPAPGATVFSLVSVSATASDNVGIAGVQFVLDGVALGAEVTAAPYSVVWDTSTATAGSHTLTAVARDFSGNQTTSAPVSVTVTATTTSLVGQWSAPIAWPIVAVHANLLPTGEVLAWDGQSAGHDARLWNPSTGTFTSVPNNQTNLFCSGHCALADGRLLVAGGHLAGHVGPPDTNIFDATTRTWTLVAPMTDPRGRWYPTVTTLPDGRVLVTAGELGCADCDADIPEVYDPGTNVWTPLSSASLPLPYYPHMFVLPDGRVLAASTSEHPIMSQTLDVATQTWTVVDPDIVDGGSAAMYEPAKIMKAGRSYHPDDPVVPSAASTYVIDMTQPAARWQETGAMVFARTYHTLTLLADGTVLATGGGATTDAVGVGGAALAPELWSPSTRTWATMASMQKPRLYHSTALLLPDARVLVAGGGRFNGVNEPTDQLSAEIYSPPYLFKGARPTISSAPATASYGGTIVVQTPDAARIATVSLIRLGAVTHAFNFDQRFLSLSFTAGASTLSVQAPANTNLAPPGHYMLFILDGNGIPSVSKILKLQ